jgi:hypothetical protein
MNVYTEVQSLSVISNNALCQHIGYPIANPDGYLVDEIALKTLIS